MRKYICTHTHTHITMPPVRAAHNKHHSPKERKAQSIADDLWWDSSIAKREEEENVSFPSLPNTSLSTRFFLPLSNVWSSGDGESEIYEEVENE